MSPGPDLEAASPQEKMLAMNEALMLGSLRQHELTAAAERLNEKLQAAITAHEITAGKLIERARLVDLCSDAMIVATADGNIALWNKGAEMLYGWRLEEAVGQPMHTLLQTEFPEALTAMMAHLNRVGQFSGEMVQVTHDGRRISVLCRWVLDRSSASILISHIDITARKAAELEMTRMRDTAIAASRAKDDFMAALSHELRTPLTPVLLLAEEAADDAKLPEAARKLFAMIVKNVKLEARLIDDLLDLTRIAHGKLVLELQVVDVHPILSDAVEMVRGEMQGKGIVLTMDLAADRPLVLGDPVRLQQIFWNGLRNAVKFTPSGGRISVATAILADRTVGIKIIDTGMGITAQELARLFAPFAQGDHSLTGGAHRFGGLGLGLSISRSLAELQAGAITVTSPGLNRGAVFSVELPLHREPRDVVRDDTPPPAAPAPSALPQPKAALRILLVEDHESTRSALTHLLRRRHYEVTPVGSLAEAREAARHPHFDLLISDLGLPDGDGHDLMAELGPLLGVKGIALSGYGDEANVTTSRLAGFAFHLTKPVSIHALEQALTAVARA